MISTSRNFRRRGFPSAMGFALTLGASGPLGGRQANAQTVEAIKQKSRITFGIVTD